MPNYPDDYLTTYIHLPIPPDREEVMDNYYRNILGFGGGYSEYWVRDDGSIRIQFKEVDDIDKINFLGTTSLASIFMPGDFLLLCDRWFKAGANIELLLLDPVGFTAVLVDPAMNRLEFRGSKDTNYSEIDVRKWDFFRAF